MTPEQLARSIAHSPVEPRAALLHRVRALSEFSLAAALKALFRQQVHCGHVLADPAGGIDERRIADPEAGLELKLQWNPKRELRKDHALLRQRGIIASVPDDRLINFDARGVPCPLCEHNMRLQNPSEILLGLQLGDEAFVAGANFAPIGDHHFTVMSAEHRPQRYHPGVLRAGLELAARTDGEFRVLFNSCAGASIPEHEHLQAMTTELPIERLAAPAPATPDETPARLAQLPYYLPLWLAEGSDADAVIAAADRVLRAWHRLDPEHHTENLLMSARGDRLRVHILLRDCRLLRPPELVGNFATCEAGGLLVFSHQAAAGAAEPDERTLFQRADIDFLRRQYRALVPARPLRPDDL